MVQPKPLNYIDTGNGPVVVLLHGYLASSAYWQRVIDKLASNHRVIAIDLLGFGKSPKPACSSYDYKAQLASINQTLDTIGIQKRFTLMGHSMGALIALRYASLNRARVSKLVLANMPVFLTSREARRDIRSSNIIYRVGLYPVVHDMVWPLFRIITKLKLLPERVAEGAASRRDYLFQSTGYSRLRSLRNVIFAVAIEADLKRLEVQTTLVSGVYDRQRYLRNLARLRRDTRIVSTIVEGGHHLPLTNPELFAGLA